MAAKHRTPVMTYLEPELKERLEQLARREERTLSSTIRMILREDLGRRSL